MDSDWGIGFQTGALGFRLEHWVSDWGIGFQTEGLGFRLIMIETGVIGSQTGLCLRLNCDLG